MRRFRGTLALASVVLPLISASAADEDLAGRILAMGRTSHYVFQIQHSAEDPKQLQIQLTGFENKEPCILPITNWTQRERPVYQADYAFFEAKVQDCGNSWSQWTKGRTVLRGYLKPTGRFRGNIVFDGPGSKLARFPIEYGMLRGDK